jgi:hypothetical protein
LSDAISESTIRIDGSSIGVIANAKWLRTIRVSRAATLKAHLLAANEETLRILAGIPQDQKFLAAAELLKAIADKNGELTTEQFQNLFRSVLALSENHITAEIISELVDLLPDQRAFLETLIEDYPDVARRWIECEEEGVDVVGIAYRSSQLQIFNKLLTDVSFFEEQQRLLQSQKKEAVWQAFFERNPWIFGYGLNYVFLKNVVDNLETVTTGASFDESGKRVDGLMQTVAAINSLCFIEIKTHVTPLMGDKSYRSGCFVPTRELAGGVAQLQGAVQLRSKSGGVIDIPDPETGRSLAKVYNYQPKAFLVIGSLEQFQGTDGVELYRYRSFELYRRGILSPEIITFDELYARAWHIVHTAEAAARECGGAQSKSPRDSEQSRAFTERADELDADANGNDELEDNP